MRTLLLPGFVALSVAVPRAADACTTDLDCKGNRICEDGNCVSPGGRSTAKKDEPASIPAEDSFVNLFVNAGGVLGFGPTPSIEFGSGAFAGHLRVRLVYLGVVAHVLAALSDDTMELASFGVGGGLRGYFGGNMRGFFVGAGVEFLSFSSKEGADEEHEGIRYPTKSLALGTEAGYRWVFSSGFTLGVGGMLGYNKILSADTEVPPEIGETSWENDIEDQVIAMVLVELGVML